MRSASGCWSPSPCSACSIGINWSSSPAAHHVLQVDERVVLVAVGDGVESQHRRLRRQLHVEESGAERGVALAAGAEHSDVALRERLGGRAASAPGLSSPSRTKSEFGSKITTGSAVCAMSCSSTTPSA